MRPLTSYSRLLSVHLQTSSQGLFACANFGRSAGALLCRRQHLCQEVRFTLRCVSNAECCSALKHPFALDEHESSCSRGYAAPHSMVECFDQWVAQCGRRIHLIWRTHGASPVRQTAALPGGIKVVLAEHKLILCIQAIALCSANGSTRP